MCVFTSLIYTLSDLAHLEEETYQKGRNAGELVPLWHIDGVRRAKTKPNESTTTRTAGGLDFTAIGGKRHGREVPQSLRVKPGARHPVWKTQ